MTPISGHAVRTVAVVLGRLDDSPGQRCSGRCWLVAAKHVGIKIDITGPDDGAELVVDCDRLEDAHFRTKAEAP